MTKTAVITGSTSGIGLAIAKAFAKGGANIVLNGFGSPDEIKKATDDVSALTKIHCAIADFTPMSRTRPARAANSADSALGRPNSFTSVAPGAEKRSVI